VVPFPFVDMVVSKRRPAVLLSNEAFNRSSGQSICAMITTGAGSSWPSDIAITDSAAAGLNHVSVIRWKVFTLPNDLILRRAGRLGSIDFKTLAAAGLRYLQPEQEAIEPE